MLITTRRGGMLSKWQSSKIKERTTQLIINASNEQAAIKSGQTECADMEGEAIIYYAII